MTSGQLITTLFSNSQFRESALYRLTKICKTEDGYKEDELLRCMAA